MLPDKDIATLADARIRVSDGDPSGMCVSWSAAIYDWLTDKEKRPLLPEMPDIGELAPDREVIMASSATLPERSWINYRPMEHSYLLIGEKILDPTISQFFSRYEELSETVLGRREPFFFGTREELRRLVDASLENTRRFIRENHGTFDYAAIGNAVNDARLAHAPDPTPYPLLLHVQPEACFERCWGTKSLLQETPGLDEEEGLPELAAKQARQCFGADVQLKTHQWLRALDKAQAAQTSRA